MDQSTILIVEDEDALREALTIRLKQEGYTTVAASDGNEGLITALEKHPDIILLDINMPIMDGMSMMKKLREDPWGKNVPIVILTNISPDSARGLDDILYSHPVYYLIKSNSSLEEVVQKVGELI